MSELPTPKEREEKFNKFIISEYLKYGSVDEVFRRNGYNLPISYPGVHRLLDRWGIVKAAGPNSKLSEAICFMELLSHHKIPMERVYRMLPPSFQTSMSTMHRILHNIKEGTTRRSGCALVITPDDNSRQVLVGDDVSTPRLELGKPFGARSLPMCYAKVDENYKDSVLRVLQQEVLVKDVVERKLDQGVISDSIQPFMYLDIADVRVSVFHLVLPRPLEKFSSYKLLNYRFVDLKELNLPSEFFRAGIREIGIGFEKYLLNRKESNNPSIYRSFVNNTLYEPALEASV